MGTVYKETFTKPLPAGTKIIVHKGERFAEWADAKQKRRTAPVTAGNDGTDRIVITSKKLLDVAGAIEALPALPLVGREASEAVDVRATGTDDLTASQFAPEFAPASAKSSTLQSIVDKSAIAAEETKDAEAVALSACPVKRNSPRTSLVNGLLRERETGIEPATTSLGS